MRWLVIAFSLLLLPCAGQAQQSASAPRQQVARIQALFVEAARQHGLKLAADPALSAAAADLLRATADRPDPPQSDLILQALGLHQIVEPEPHLVMSQFSMDPGPPGGEVSGLLDELRPRLPKIMAAGRWRRIGLAVAPAAGDELRLMVLLVQSFIDLRPVSRELPQAGSAQIAGQLLSPYEHPEILVTDPAGKVSRVAVQGASAKGRAFAGMFHCTDRGRFQIEVLGEDRYGSTVLANFPLYCGEQPPTSLKVETAASALPFRTVAEAEQQVFALVQADRARQGLPKLVWDERLAQVARAHSKDMRDHGFLGHTSPTTGDATARVRRAGILTTVLAENLGRAYSPQEIERGLMDSPGHRANILNADVTHGAVGVELRELEDGLRELLVTQLFIRRLEPVDLAQAPQLVRQRVAALRAQAGVGGLNDDPQLDRLAQRIAAGLGQGRLSEDRVGQPLEEAKAQLAGRFRAVRAVLAVSADPERLESSAALLDRKMTHLGVAVAEQRKGVRGVYVVLVLGREETRSGATKGVDERGSGGLFNRDPQNRRVAQW